MFYSDNVTTLQIEKAKSVDLVEYLTHTRPHLITYDRASKRYLHSEHDSCVISPIGFYRFSNHDRGDQIQFLQNYCNMSFQNAVRALCGYAGDNAIHCLPEIERPERVRNFTAPEAYKGRYKCSWSYLVYKRKIPKEVVEAMFENGTLYQSAEHNNCVFLSKASCCNYAELCGTTDIKYKKIHNDSDPDGYWTIGNEGSNKVYVCESAIDAISLMLLHQKYTPEEDACYASMGGLKDRAIETLSELYDQVIVAVDNDKAGDEFREKYPSLYKIVPPRILGSNAEVTKDWNDVLRYAENENAIIKSLTEGYYENDLPF